MHASLTRQSVPWEAVIALDGASPDRLPDPLAQDSRVRTLALPRPVGAACARNLALPMSAPGTPTGQMTMMSSPTTPCPYG